MLIEVDVLRSTYYKTLIIYQLYAEQTQVRLASERYGLDEEAWSLTFAFLLG